MFSELDLISSYKFTGKEPVMIDVGAHHGFLALPFAKLGWKIIAFEPENSNYRAFKRNLRKFKNVRVFKLAVSNISGVEVPFYVSSKYYGIHSLKKFDKSHIFKYKVKTVRLDEKLREIGINEVSFLKIDIEGADFLALKSFDFETYTPEVVMVEFMDKRTIKHFGYEYKDMVKFMSKKGYSAFISEWSEIKEYGQKNVETEPSNWLGCTPYNKINHVPSWGNLIFVPKINSSKFTTTLKLYLDSLKNNKTIDVLYCKVLEFISIARGFVNDIRVNLGNNGEIGIIDVGAADGLPMYWNQNPMLVKKIIRFEPRGGVNFNKDIISCDVALWKDKSVKNFYIYQGNGGTGSSLFKQNNDYVKKNYVSLCSKGPTNLSDTWFERSKIKNTQKIKCTTLDIFFRDNEIDATNFDLLKIDAQGAEYEILEGSLEYLKSGCVAVFLETFSIPLYKNIKLLPDIMRFLEKLNFQLVKKFPSHGTFNSQNDCLFIKKGANKNKVNIIKKVYNI